MNWMMGASHEQASWCRRDLSHSEHKSTVLDLAEMQTTAQLVLLWL